MNWLLSISLLSLMVPIRLGTSLALLRPFEILTVLAFAFGLSRESSRVRLSGGLLILAPYLLWHILSAAQGGMDNAVRETLQVGVIAMFALVLSQARNTLDIKLIGRLLGFGMAVIILATVLWHLSNGYWVGWKQFADTRLAFAFLPVLLALYVLFSGSDLRPLLWSLLIGLGPLILLSGERKALLIYLFSLGLVAARGRIALILPAAASCLLLLFLLSSTLDNPYLQKQVGTIVNLGSTGDYQYVIETGSYLPGDSPSNVQRAFALAVSRELFAENPWFGVGTNQYVEILSQRYSNLPEVMRLGIHGEFQRVLTENGIFGLVLYLAVWYVAWVRFRRLLARALDHKLLNPVQARVLPFMMFLPFVLFVGAEAPGTRSFVVLCLISLLPELTHRALASKARMLSANGALVSDKIQGASVGR